MALNPLRREYYTEKCVMNNYFGIGLDAKISLDFNNKRDEHPEKCRWVTPGSTPVLRVSPVPPREGRVPSRAGVKGARGAEADGDEPERFASEGRAASTDVGGAGGSPGGQPGGGVS